MVLRRKTERDSAVAANDVMHPWTRRPASADVFAARLAASQAVFAANNAALLEQVYELDEAVRSDAARATHVAAVCANAERCIHEIERAGPMQITSTN